MILPTKHLRAARSLLGIGAEILPLIDDPKTVSRVWDEFRRRRGRTPHMPPISYTWFVLALDFLFLLGAVGFKEGRLRRLYPS
jgi:ABC-three component (ABC-3C) system Middle Component 6